ncbi:MAG: 2-phospho-L-lactate guanylyltransferase [Chloroflexota bacterium]|nr:2-phospho-L-lactate guanylyltransferase [Chloroflexota bacterium]
MKTVAVVPVKGLAETKGRLAGELYPQERSVLTLETLAHVLGAIQASGVIDHVAVITPDAEELDLPSTVHIIKQTRNGLNNLLEQGRQWAEQMRADALLITFADLPLLTPGDVAAMVAMGEERNTVVLAPDRHKQGTNMLLTHPVQLAQFSFGENSYSRHKELNRAQADAVESYFSDGTSIDIDTPDDLALLGVRVWGLGVGC